MSRRKHRKRQRARKGTQMTMGFVPNNVAKKGKVVSYPSTCYSHQLAEVFILDDDRSVYAGALRSVQAQIERGALKPALVLNLAGTNDDFMPDWPVEVNERAAAVLPPELFERPEDSAPAVMTLDWADGGVPLGLTAGWWTLLAKAIQESEGDVVVCCFGGHGRTGVVLSILADRLGLLKDGEDPVAWVRDHYCDSAVETQVQILYVERMTGRTVKELPSEGYDYHRSGYLDYKASSGSPVTVRDLFPEDYGAGIHGLDDGVQRTIARHRTENADMVKGQ